jgi:hypothetical protein
MFRFLFFFTNENGSLLKKDKERCGGNLGGNTHLIKQKDE